MGKKVLLFAVMFGVAGVLMAVPPNGAPAVPMIDYAPGIYPGWGVDTPQPDTISYDEGFVVRLYGNPFYVGVRFTPLLDFDLRAVYLCLSYYNHTTTYSLWVAGDDGTGQGNPADIRLTVTGLVPQSGWQQIDLPDTLTFLANEDFHIIYGPTESTLHPSNLTGYYPACDYSSGNGRSNLGYSWPTSALTPFSYDFDWCVRAGGEYQAGTWVDAAVSNVDNSDLMWFLCEDDVVTYRATVGNVGTENITGFDVAWVVEDAVGTPVFNTSASFGALAVGIDTIVSATSSWTATTSGEYYVTATVTATGDVAAGNNSKKIEQQVYDPDLSTLLDYEEGVFAGNLSLGLNNGRAMEFTPCSYPIEITNVEVQITSDAGLATVQVIGDDGTDAPDPSNILFDTTMTMVVGVNTIPVGSIPIVSGSFYVAYFTASATNTSLPAANAPHAGNNTTMGIIWSTSNGGTTWTFSPGSDHPLRARIMAFGGVIRDIRMDWMTFPGFFFGPGSDPFDGQIQVKNNGTATDTFNVSLTIEDTTFARSVLFSQTLPVVGLAPGDSALLTFNPYTFSAVGEYILTGNAIVPGDATPGDNTIMAESQLCQYPSRLTYDDGTFESGWAFNTAGYFWGARFDPPIYPCRITQMSTYFTSFPVGYDDARMKIYDDDGTTVRYNYLDTSIDAGWNLYTVPNLLVMNGFFYAGTEWVTAYPNAPFFGTDSNDPISYMARQLISGIWYYDVEEAGVRVTVDAIRLSNVVIQKTGGTDNVNINLSWSFPGIAGETWYFIYKSNTVTGTYALADSVLHPTQTWNDTNVPGWNKFYHVTFGDVSGSRADALPGEYLWSPFEITASGNNAIEPGVRPISEEKIRQATRQ